MRFICINGKTEQLPDMEPFNGDNDFLGRSDLLSKNTKKLEEELQGTERLLGIANRTVKEQMDVIEKLNKYINILEAQLSIQDNAIVRKDTIISYLESKLLK